MYNKIKLCKGQYEYSDQDINRFLWEEHYALRGIFFFAFKTRTYTLVTLSISKIMK